jgi:AraC-like DNA-binding protein
MILLIGDCTPCSLHTAMSNTGQKIAFLQANAPLFSQNMGNALEDAALKIAVIECVFHERQGLELLRKIKQNRHDVPVIFICSSDSDRTVAEAFRLGARDCFRKPVDVRRLKERITILLQVKDASKERRVPHRPDKDGATEPTCATTDIPDNILRVLNYIEDHMSSHTLCIVRLAKVAGMSPFHFCRVFKKHMAKTPMQYLSCLRVEKAKDLLKYSSANMSVSMIADSVGFYDSSNLNKHFKKATGVTPTAFKRFVKSAKAK